MIPSMSVAYDGTDAALAFINAKEQCALVCGTTGCVGACQSFQPARDNSRASPSKKGGEYIMETITQGASGPVAVVGKSDGPYWSSFGASEAALSTINYMGQSRTDSAIFSHFLRDSIERRNDVSELRAEIRDLKNGQKKDDVNGDLVSALVAALKK